MEQAKLFTRPFVLCSLANLTQGLALFGVSGMLPIALGGLFGDLILQRSDFDAVFVTALVFSVASLLLSLPLFDRPRLHGQAEPSRGFRAALQQPDLLPLWWIGIVFALALASVFAFLRRFVDETGIGTVGGFFAAYAGAAIAVRIFLGRLPDRVGPKRVLFPALGVLAAGFLVLAGASDARDVMLAGVLCGIGHGYIFPVLFALVVTRASQADRGSAMAIFTALFDVGWMLGGLLFGALSRSLGFAATYATAAGVIVLGTALFAGWDRRR